MLYSTITWLSKGFQNVLEVNPSLGIGGVLSQDHHPIAYISKKYNETWQHETVRLLNTRVHVSKIISNPPI